MKSPLQQRQRRNPFSAFQQIQKDWDKWFEDLSPVNSQFANWDLQAQPSCNLTEDSNFYYVKADLPGVSKDQIKIELAESTLTIQAERQEEVKKEDEKQHLIESFRGTYLRSFFLPLPVDEKKAEARYENGVLSLKLPKISESKAKQINVN